MFKPGDIVRHVHKNWSGIVVSVTDTYWYHVKWTQADGRQLGRAHWSTSHRAMSLSLIATGESND
jgi:hypothetical protein